MCLFWRKNALFVNFTFLFIDQELFELSNSKTHQNHKGQSYTLTLRKSLDR